MSSRPETDDRLYRVLWRDAGLLVVSAAALAGAELGLAFSPALLAGTVVAIVGTAAMHARLAMFGRWSILLQVATGAAMLYLVGAQPRFSITVLVTGLAVAELIATHTRRSGVLQTGLWNAVAAGVLMAGLSAAASVPLAESIGDAMGAALGGFLCAPIVLTFGPVLEWVFGHTTRLTMREWLSYDQPLLRDLASLAPGTFQHSVNVGVLAEAAASAIRADALVAQVGGLYHDVGKIRAPGYFVENQHGPNPHDQMLPWDSARVLRAHVFDGVDFVMEHGMGGRIADFVREHHGTGTMRVFQDKAERMEGPGPADEDYRYPGPKPRSRETGIVMMADQTEATARSAPPEDDAACDAVVNRTIDRIQAEGELSDAGLNAEEMAAIRRAFSRTLQAMYHHRVVYPHGKPAAPAKAPLGLVPRMLRRPRRPGP